MQGGVEELTECEVQVGDSAILVVGWAVESWLGTGHGSREAAEPGKRETGYMGDRCRLKQAVLELS